MSSFPVTAVLDAGGSSDAEAPVTVIQLDGQKSPFGWYIGPVTVTMSATDNPGGTGVASIQYTTDGGKTALVYNSPFVVDAERVSLILAKASDAAGNEEVPLARKNVGASKSYLPAISIP